MLVVTLQIHFKHSDSKRVIDFLCAVKKQTMAASDPRVYIGPIKMGPLMVIATFCADSETKTSGEVQCVYNYKSNLRSSACTTIKAI